MSSRAPRVRTSRVLPGAWGREKHASCTRTQGAEKGQPEGREVVRAAAKADDIGCATLSLGVVSHGPWWSGAAQDTKAGVTGHTGHTHPHTHPHTLTTIEPVPNPPRSKVCSRRKVSKLSMAHMDRQPFSPTVTTRCSGRHTASLRGTGDGVRDTSLRPEKLKLRPPSSGACWNKQGPTQGLGGPGSSAVQPECPRNRVNVNLHHAPPSPPPTPTHRIPVLLIHGAAPSSLVRGADGQPARVGLHILRVWDRDVIPHHASPLVAAAATGGERPPGAPPLSFSGWVLRQNSSSEEAWWRVWVGGCVCVDSTLFRKFHDNWAHGLLSTLSRPLPPTVTPVRVPVRHVDICRLLGLAGGWWPAPGRPLTPAGLAALGALALVGCNCTPHPPSALAPWAAPRLHSPCPGIVQAALQE
jgi:hypothetical protein